MVRRIVLIALILLTIVPVGIVAWLLFTESGLTAIAAQLYRLEQFGVRIEDVSGTVRGPLAIGSIEVDTDTVHVTARGIAAEPLLRSTVLQTVAFDWVRIESVDVRLKHGRGDETEREGGPRFLPAWLRVLAERVEIGATRFATADGFEITATRVAGRLELTRSRLLASDLLVESADFVAGGRVQLEADTRIDIDIAANGRLTREPWPRAEVAATLRGYPGRLAVEARLETPGDAATSLEILTGEAGWRIEGRARSDDPELAAWIDDPPVTPRDVELAFSLDRDGFVIDGAVTVPEIDAAPIELAVQGSYADRTLTIGTAALRPQDTETVLELSGRTTFGEDRPALDFLLTWERLAWPLRDEPILASRRGTVAVAGAMPYRIDGSAELEVPGQPAAEVALAGYAHGDHVSLDAFTVVGEPGLVSGRGRLDYAAPQRWQATLRGTGVDLSPWLPTLPSAIDVAVALEGTGLDAGTVGRASIEKLGGTLRGAPLSGAGTVIRKSDGWRAEQLAVGIGPNRLTIDGRVDDRLDARWTLDAPALEILLPEARGELRFTGAASGPKSTPLIEAQLEGSDLEYGGTSIGRVAGHAKVDLAADAPSLIRLDAADVGGKDPTVAKVALVAEGRPSQHEISLDTQFVPAAEDQAAVALHLEAQGAYRDRTWSGTLHELLGRIGDDELLTLEAPTRVSAAAEAIDIAPLCLSIRQARLCARADWQAGGPWSTTGDLDRLPLEAVGEVLPGRPGLGGQLTGQFAMRGRGATLIEGTADLRLVDGELRYQLVGGDADAVELGSGAVSLNATPERFFVDARLDASAETFIAAQVNVARDPDLPLLKQNVTGTISARSNDTGAITLVVPELDEVAGRIEADFAMFGTLGAPRFDGSLALREGKVELYRFNTVLEDIDFLARLRDRRIEIAGSSRLGEGTLQIDGSLIWRDLEPHGVIRLRGENLLIADGAYLRLVASPDLEFDVSGRKLVATGEVVIPSAHIDPRDLTGAQSVSSDARLVGEEPLPADAEAAFDVRTEIRVTLGDDVTIDAAGLTGRLDGSLVTRSGYSEVETGRGEIRVVDGRYEAYGQKLEIKRGRLIFDDTPLGDPGLDIQAEKELPEVKVGLNVRGTLRDPRLTLYSDPSMPQNQILSYLLIGKPIDEAGGQDAVTVSNAANSLALSGGGFLASQIGRQIGLEEVAIESTGEDDTELVLGKFLSPRLYVSYGISLTESINTAKLRYTITDNWVLRVEAGEYQSADFEFTIER